MLKVLCASNAYIIVGDRHRALALSRVPAFSRLTFSCFHLSRSSALALSRPRVFAFAFSRSCVLVLVRSCAPVFCVFALTRSRVLAFSCSRAVALLHPRVSARVHFLAFSFSRFCVFALLRFPVVIARYERSFMLLFACEYVGLWRVRPVDSYISCLCGRYALLHRVCRRIIVHCLSACRCLAVLMGSLIQ
jgi:hypothetical protein